MRRLSRVSLLSLCAALTIPRVALAVPVTWAFEGTLRVMDSIETLPGGRELATGLPAPIAALGVQVGAPMSGFLRFEATTPDLASNPTNADYSGTVLAGSLTIGNWSVAGSIDYPGSYLSFDDVVVNANHSTSSEGEFISLSMFDPTGTYSSSLAALEMSKSGSSVFATAAMLIDPPALSALDPFTTVPGTAWGHGTAVSFYTHAVDAMGNTLSSEFFMDVTSLERIDVTPPILVSLPGMPEPGAGAFLALVLVIGAVLRR